MYLWGEVAQEFSSGWAGNLDNNHKLAASAMNRSIARDANSRGSNRGDAVHWTSKGATGPDMPGVVCTAGARRSEFLDVFQIWIV